MSSMIQSARPTVWLVANIVFTFFCLARFSKVGTDDKCANNYPYRRDCGLAEWIKKYHSLLTFCTPLYSHIKEEVKTDLLSHYHAMKTNKRVGELFPLILIFPRLFALGLY